MAERPNPTDVHIGRRLRKLRMVLGVDEGRLAELLQISPDQYRQFEEGAARIGAPRLLSIAKFLRVNPIYFFEGSARVPAPSDDCHKIRGAAGAKKGSSSKRTAQLYRIFADPTGSGLTPGLAPRADDGPTRDDK
jgi:transcriptional regulator with XRE-family HTH domain